MDMYADLPVTWLTWQPWKYASSKHPVCKINNLRLFDNTIKTFDKFLMDSVFLNVVVSIFLIREFDDEGVRDTILPES